MPQKSSQLSEANDDPDGGGSALVAYDTSDAAPVKIVFTMGRQTFRLDPGVGLLEIQVPQNATPAITVTGTNANTTGKLGYTVWMNYNYTIGTKARVA
jgi:hypothetical protein